MGPGCLPSRFSTVEGLLIAIKEQLERQSSFFMGDSAPEEEKQKFKELMDKLKRGLELKEKITIVLDDPAGNSYLQVNIFLRKYYFMQYMHISVHNC